jgi:cytochrome c oxidase cbb3-type subunit III
MKAFNLCIAVVLLCSVLLASDDPPQSEAAKRGQAVFSQSCGFCHAADATGTGQAPNLVRSDLVRHDENGNLIGPVIRDGRPGKGMPPIHLSEPQISDVIAFLQWRLADADRTNPADPHAYSLQRLLTGNAAAGKAFFDRQCTACHSASKDLAGIAKKYPPAKLQSRFLYPDDVKKTATVTTPSGDHVSGTVVYQDAFTIGIQDRDGWYHSWPADQVKFQIQDPLAGHFTLLHTYTNAEIHNLFAYLETLQ